MRLSVLLASYCISKILPQCDAFVTISSPKVYNGKRIVEQSKFEIRQDGCRRYASASTTRETEEGTRTKTLDQSTKVINMEALSRLRQCTSAASARQTLYEAIVASNQKDPPDNSSSITNSTFVRTSSPMQPLYNSLILPRGATLRTISDADLSIQTGIRGGSYKVTDLIDTTGESELTRLRLFVPFLTLLSTVTAIATNQYLLPPGSIPEILRFVVVWCLCFAPLAFVGSGIVKPDLLLKTGFMDALQMWFLPSSKERMVHHEAGHFLLGYLLGMPVKSFTITGNAETVEESGGRRMANAVEFYPLSDPTAGTERARLLGFDKFSTQQQLEQQQQLQNVPSSSSDQPYFSKDGRGGEYMRDRSVFRREEQSQNNDNTSNNNNNNNNKPKQRVSPTLPLRNDPTKSWPYRGFDQDTLTLLSVVSLGGVCAELLGYGNAEGGYADLQQLKQLYSAASTESGMTEGEKENCVRFAIGYGMSQLRRHVGALDALVEVMGKPGGGTVEECVLAIESCTTLSPTTPNSKSTSSSSSYEEARREQLLAKTNPIEKWLMSMPKNARDVDNRIEGKGGGEKQGGGLWDLVGDDPLYAALAVAGVFFLWASNGGLSLH